MQNEKNNNKSSKMKKVYKKTHHEIMAFIINDNPDYFNRRATSINCINYD